ncbi:Ribose-5-phosphate isomerase B [Chlamydia abortus]|nr:Ribose-5-phosphate isomerase B [Chlamydia abortus]
MKKIAIGSDHHGFEMKELIIAYLRNRQIEAADYGCYSCEEVDYPDVAFAVADDIRKGKLERGILICGTGIGVAIAANKVPGIRAAQCHDTYSAERARKSNNAQIMTMGAKVIGPETALKIVEAWIDSEFQRGNSERKVNKIMEQEQHYLRSGDDEKADESTQFGC